MGGSSAMPSRSMRAGPFTSLPPTPELRSREERRRARAQRRWPIRTMSILWSGLRFGVEWPLALALLRLDTHAVAHGRLTRAHVRPEVDRHHALEADADAAVEPTRRVVARGGSQHPGAGGEKRGGDALALDGLHGQADDHQRELPVTVPTSI